MFKIYDLNMKELPFPEGVKPLDIFVSSVNKRRLTEEIEGRSGTLNYGYDYGERSVDLSLWLEAHDTIDYRLIRNELYAFFDTHDVFYVEETRVPSRVLKVTIDESYIPERINQTHSSVEISCRTLDSVFWESKYTTLELHDSGYSATAEKYGLVDNIDDEKVKYRFKPEHYNENLMTTEFDFNSPISTPFKNILRGGLPYGQYTISFEYKVLSGSPSGFLVFANGTLTTVNIGSGRVHSVFNVNQESSNTTIRLYSGASASEAMSTDVEFRNVKIEKGFTPTKFDPLFHIFSVYNAGNVTVEPESMYLDIIIAGCTGPKVTIRNKTTGESLEINVLTNNHVVRQNGMIVTVGGVNRFRDTNRRFISLTPGDNEFEVSGSTFSQISFNTKFYYK